MDYALHSERLQTPVGTLSIYGDVDAVSAVHIGDHQAPSGTITAPPDSPVAQAAAQLRAYFAGQRMAFDAPIKPLPSLRGTTLRDGMIAIPFGKTETYGSLARILGSAPRAIGQACRRNPLPILVPCHRVISSAGPEFYSAGEGPQTKAWLIDFEARSLAAAQRNLGL